MLPARANAERETPQDFLSRKAVTSLAR